MPLRMNTLMKDLMIRNWRKQKMIWRRQMLSWRSVFLSPPTWSIYSLKLLTIKSRLTSKPPSQLFILLSGLSPADQKASQCFNLLACGEYRVGCVKSRCEVLTNSVVGMSESWNSLSVSITLVVFHSLAFLLAFLFFGGSFSVSVPESVPDFGSESSSESSFCFSFSWLLAVGFGGGHCPLRPQIGSLMVSLVLLDWLDRAWLDWVGWVSWPSLSSETGAVLLVAMAMCLLVFLVFFLFRLSLLVNSCWLNCLPFWTKNHFVGQIKVVRRENNNK